RFNVDTNVFENRLNDISESTVTCNVVNMENCTVARSKTYKFPKFTNDIRRVEALDILRNLYEHVTDTDLRSYQITITVKSPTRETQTSGIAFFSYYGVGEKGVLRYV
ncbi:hypothetical protein V6O07_06130, partial [Arthrospira platensis SPKY2]